ncbi:thylakoid membrane photosystem I accumulation factor [Phormidium sp. LEGE 05292]|uniref:thylakoid membrane photosystem I accumulation factor n=1 Tax=[Phormidium] sp. LEGE 05292 TaxID=767427 RepID=UPI001880DE76|nr:thylakoid membrane photosystem I accumulation factor [Phormidium sp. LEGE 05292]MBE9223935.1 thylakoid membrane photosystem I accumulation factor [Phormidium sp. LEGE 05292]
MSIATFLNSGRRLFSWLILVVATLSCLFLFGTPSALAGMNNDNYDGNIFVLYGGNGSLVPPKVTLAESLKRDKPTLLVYYADDSKDCKQYAIVVSQLQAFYGRAADFIPVSVDSIPIKSNYAPTEVGYYYKDFVPQVVLLDKSGKQVINEKGQVPFEKIDDAFRELFNLLPRTESKELKPRAFNEFNSELAN